MNIATDLFLTRFPATRNKSLQAFNAADQLMLNIIEGKEISCGETMIFNDRFGALTCGVNSNHTQTVVHLKSQRDAVAYNIEKNEVTNTTITTPFNIHNSLNDCILIQATKSLGLFEVFLQQAAQNLSKDGTVLCGFMTKYFTKSWLEIAAKYFDNVAQSLAYKKARVLILSQPKTVNFELPLKSIENAFDLELVQYPGVFSGKHIDHATAFLMENLILDESIENVLDVASGNGVLGKYVGQKSHVTHLHFVDDNIFAIESAKINVTQGEHHWNFHLKEMPSDHFQYIISNPPFHFEHEKGTETTLNLMQQIKRCLAPNGVFQMVANKSLNYTPTLKQLFNRVDVTAKNKYYFVYTCMQ